MRLAVLGIGLMGYPMARRLCQAGHCIQVWNRTLHKAQRLLPDGAAVHQSPAEAVAQAELVLTMLEDGTAVEDVLFGMGTALAMRSGSTVVDMSSIKPEQAHAHAARLADLGLAYLDAPVSGGTIGAENGTLAIMAGGAVADFERALPILNILGRATHVGPTGSGQMAKLANQMIVGATIGVVAEALLLCERAGADIARVREALAGGFADSRVLQVHGQRMVARDFAPRGRMTVQLKDLRNALSCASTAHFDAPITTLLEQLYTHGVVHGLADCDQSALFLELARRNGMECRSIATLRHPDPECASN